MGRFVGSMAADVVFARYLLFKKNAVIAMDEAIFC
jgi:hypothetical protein